MDISSMTPEQLASTPMVPPPPGQTSNFVNPVSKAPGLTAAISVILALMLAVLCLRFYSKTLTTKRFGLDDWAALIGGIFTTAIAGLIIAMFYGPGFAVHSWDVPLISLLEPAYANRTFALEILAPWSTFFVKVSILLFLLIIFPRKTNPKTGYLIYAGIALNCLFYTMITLYTGIACGPRGPHAERPAKCTLHLLLQVGEAVAGVNVFLDLYVLAIAIPTVMRLKMRWSKRIGVALVLCTGSLAFVLSICALYYRAADDNDIDPSWNACTGIALGFFEPAIGIIAACLPTLPAVWRHVSSKKPSSLNHLLGRVSFGKSTTPSGLEPADRGAGKNSVPSHIFTKRDADSDLSDSISPPPEAKVPRQRVSHMHSPV